MREITQMIVVLSVICLACGVALSGLRTYTADRIETQILLNVQGPKVNRLLQGSTNDLLKDRRKIRIGDQDILVFVGKKQGKPWALAYETTGKGFGGNLTVMVGYDLDNDNLTGIQVVSHKETPGVGSRVTEDAFTSRFGGLHVDLQVPANQCPSEIDAISGATYSSLGVCEALRKSLALYPEVKQKVLGS